MKSIDLKEKKQEFLREAKSLVALATEEERDLTEEEEGQVSELMAKADKAERQAVMLGKLEEQEQSRGRVYIPEPQDLPRDPKRPYSLMRAIGCMLDGKPVDGLEGEVSQEIAQRNGKGSGFYMPLDTRALDSTTGTGSVATEYATSLIEMLRNKSVVMQAGATVLPNLEGAGTYTIPKQTGAATAYWVSESGDTTASNQTIGSVSLAPNTCSAMTEVSRRFIKTASVDAEALVREDLSRVIALAVDYAALYGDGTNQGDITGVLQDTNTNSVTAGDGTNGANLILADLFNMEKEIAVDNAEFNGATFVTGPKLRAWLKYTDVAYDSTVSHTGQYFWKPDNTLIGYPAMASCQIPEAITVGSATCSAIVLGAFSQMLIGFWGGAAEIIVDPLSLSKSGGVRIVALTDVDMALRNAVAFCRCVDAANT